jgi:two-component system NtrC family sensor kinase
VLGDSDQSARLEAVVAEVKRLNRLLSERVDAARHAPEPMVPMNLKATVEDFLSLVRYQVPEGVRLSARISEDLVCRLPEGGLRQTLLNLVLNAAQSMEGGEGEVEVQARWDGQAVALSVIDGGPGFPPEMLTVGVRPFASGRVGGTGLGLAMVRRFAEDINADLELANRESGGARVTLRLPCARTGPEAEDRGTGDA